MDPIIGASVISAGSNILGGIMDDRSADRANQASLEFSYHQLRNQNRNARVDRRMQREFARNSLRWRVADARAAGLSPLAALGAQLSPSSPVGGMGVPAPDTYTGSAKGDAVRAAGAAIAEALARRDKEKAETRLLNAQADLVSQQAADSQVARITQGMQNDVATPEFHELQKPQFTSSYILPGGIKMKRAPSSNMQSIVDALGEPAEWVLFPVRAGEEIGYNGALKAFEYFSRSKQVPYRKDDPVFYTYE